MGVLQRVYFPIAQGTHPSGPRALPTAPRMQLQPRLRSRFASQDPTAPPRLPRPRHTSVSSPQYEAGRCIKDKPFQRLNLLHPSGLNHK